MDEPSNVAMRRRITESESLACDVCGGPVFELRCKVICPRCGYTRDCSDP